MSILPLSYLPGVCKVNSAYADTVQGGYANGRVVSGRFTDMDKTRFVAGLPEKLGGWLKDIQTPTAGIPRGILPWRDNAQNIRLAVGTNLKLYYETSAGLVDITPWRAILTGTLTNALTTNSTNVVSVAHTAHGLQTGDYIILVAGSAIGGITPAGVFNPITRVDANNYTFVNPIAASGSVSGGGGTITYTYFRVTLSNPFATVNGSPIVTVTHTAHGAMAGDFVTISNATAVAGLTLNGEFQINSASTNTYTITAPSAANATTTGGGTPQFQYDLTGGPADTVTGFGYGTGGYGGPGGYGTPGSIGITFLARVWSLAHYGQQLLASPTAGTIYIWDPVIGGRAYPMFNAPSQVLAMFVTPERFVVALGINGNAMQIAWADQNDYTVWTTTPTNTANTGRTLQSGAFFVGGVPARDGLSLIVTNTACINMTYTGDNNVYATQTIGDGSGLCGPLAITVIGGVAYWMGLSEFWTWNGSVNPLPSDDIRDFVFQNCNLSQAQKFVAGANRAKKEVFFFYCTANSNEINAYVIYHIDQGCWSRGTLQRTSWADLGLLSNPVATDASGFIYDHEVGHDDDVNAMDSYVVLSPQDVAKGERIMDYFSLYPDFERISGNVNFSLLTQTYPMDAEETDGPYVIASDGSTPLIDLRGSAKLVGFKLESNMLGGDWRLGLPRIEAQPAGARR